MFSEDRDYLISIGYAVAIAISLRFAEALAASSRPAGLAKSASTKDAPHLAAADSTTGSLEDEGSGGGLFSTAAQLSFADLAKQQPGTGFGFQGPSPKSGQSLFSGAGTKLFQSLTTKHKTETEDDGEFMLMHLLNIAVS